MGSTVAEVSLTEAHVDLLVPVLDVGAPLLAVTGCPGHALSLRGDAVVVVAEVLVEALHDLPRVTVMSRGEYNAHFGTFLAHFSTIGTF